MKILSMQDLEDLARQVNTAFRERDEKIKDLTERVEFLVQELNSLTEAKVSSDNAKKGTAKAK